MDKKLLRLQDKQHWEEKGFGEAVALEEAWRGREHSEGSRCTEPGGPGKRSWGRGKSEASAESKVKAGRIQTSVGMGHSPGQQLTQETEGTRREDECHPREI